MGSKGSNTTTASYKPPKIFMDAYKEALGMAREATSQPYQQYKGQLVAGLTPSQQQGIANVNAAQGMALPAIQQGMNYTNQAAQGITPELYQRFYSPYVKDVANTTFANLMESQAQQQSNLKGGAINAGAFGGDRGGIAQAEMARQQQLANSMAMSNIYNQGYGQAMGLAGQQVSNLGAMGQQIAGLGAGAQSSVLQGAQAQMAAGLQQQSTEQARLQAAYEQWMQRQSYPYQQAQFFANIAQGLGAGAGGTSSTTAPAPSVFSQIAGAAGAIGSIYSDKRVKENIEAVGKLNDGQTIYRYNFKGDPKTQIGLLAQEVEHHKPGAVSEVKGLKMVNYKDATEDSASMGGVVGPSEFRQGLAGGGEIAYFPYGDSRSYIPEGKIAGRGASIPSDPAAAKDEGLAKGWQDIVPISEEQAAGLRKFASDVGIDLPEKKTLADIFRKNKDVGPTEAEMAWINKTNPDSGLFSIALASGGVAGRQKYADGGYRPGRMDEAIDEAAGLGAVASPEEDSSEGSGVVVETVPVSDSTDNEGLGAAQNDPPEFVVAAEKPAGRGLIPKFNADKIFASEENPSIIERIMGRRLSPEARAAVMNASFALMAGRSPYFMTNLGEAGAVGTQTYYNALQQKREQEKQNAELALKTQEQQEKEARKQLVEEAISQLPPEQQAAARLAPDKFFGAQAESIFGTPDLPALVQEYNAAKKEGFEGTLEDWKKISSSSNADLGLQPVPLVDKDNNFIGFGQMSKSGGLYYNGQPIDNVDVRPMNPADVNKIKEIGKGEGRSIGEARGDLAGAEQQAEIAIKAIDDLADDPALDAAIGWTSYFPNAVVSNDVIRVRSKAQRLQGTAFLQARAILKGGGPITDYESLRAEQAYSRMETAIQSSNPKDYRDALQDFKDAVIQGVEKIRRTAQLPQTGGSEIPDLTGMTDEQLEELAKGQSDGQ